MQLQMNLMIAALLAAVPLLVHAQLPLCNINRDLATCRIADNRNCPGGCIRTSACPKTTVTNTKTATKVNTVTATRSAGTITITGSGSASTITITATESASTITVTASTSSSKPPSCKTEVPYANLFAFPDWECKNETNLIQNLEANYTGLVGPQIKFNTLTFNPATKYNESACINLLPGSNGARSIYYTIDGYPRDSFPSCSMNLYTGQQCSGNPESRYFHGGRDSCRAVGKSKGSWRSVQFKCVYPRDVCTENEIFLGVCTKQ